MVPAQLDPYPPAPRPGETANRYAPGVGARGETTRGKSTTLRLFLQVSRPWVFC